MTINSPRRRLSKRTLLSVLPGVALLAWGGLLLYTYLVPPQNVPTVIITFVLLSLALLSSFVPLIYLLRLIVPRTRFAPSALNASIREAAFFSAWVVFNLLLLVLRSWNILALLASFGIIVVLELLLMGER